MKKNRSITILNMQNHYRIDRDHYKRLLETLVNTLAPEADEVSLLLTDDKEMRKRNLEFRGNRKTTDVLSFPAGQKNLEGNINLGDIIISVQRARSQAKEACCTIKKEIERLIIHGFLHLLGYRHGDKAMKRWEEAFLSTNGIKK
jgi:rRNA maturation RNase YbeY